MKVLVLTSRLPYPIEKGDKLRVYHQIRELAKKHELVLCSLIEEKPEKESLDHLRKFCSEIYTFPLDKMGIALSLVKAFLTGKSIQVAYFYRNSIHEKIKEIANDHKADFVFCQLIRMSEYAKDLEMNRALDYMDCFSEGMSRQAREGKKWQKPIFAREARILRNYQREIYNSFDFHSIISDQDRKLLDPDGVLDIKVMPNGIDSTYFAPIDVKEKFDLVFVGNMGYFPNINAVKYLVHRVMPLVWQKRPETSILIAGARPHADVLALGSDKRVHISGWVEDIRESYSSGKVFVAPIFAGSGQQNKILEAMAMERPCLTTPLVNNAIKAKPGLEIEEAEDEETFAEKILELLQNPAKCAQLGTRGRNFVREKYNWSKSVEELEAWANEQLLTSK
ncbi:MAG: glycosyltransferase [Bacteroidia bacterium]|nr:glycosyltransferase [Bacteroidia bacterium]